MDESPSPVVQIMEGGQVSNIQGQIERETRDAAPTLMQSDEVFIDNARRVMQVMVAEKIIGDQTGRDTWKKYIHYIKGKPESFLDYLTFSFASDDGVFRDAVTAVNSRVKLKEVRPMEIGKMKAGFKDIDEIIPFSLKHRFPLISIHGGHLFLMGVCNPMLAAPLTAMFRAAVSQAAEAKIDVLLVSNEEMREALSWLDPEAGQLDQVGT